MTATGRARSSSSRAPPPGSSASASRAPQLAMSGDGGGGGGNNNSRHTAELRAGKPGRAGLGCRRRRRLCGRLAAFSRVVCVVFFPSLFLCRALFPHRPLSRERTVPASGSGKRWSWACLWVGLGGAAFGSAAVVRLTVLTTTSSFFILAAAGSDPRSGRERGERCGAFSPLFPSPASAPEAALASPPPPPTAGGRSWGGFWGGGGAALGDGKIYAFFFLPQLLPKRTDWTGKEHPRSYESLVREAAGCSDTMWCTRESLRAAL